MIVRYDHYETFPGWGAAQEFFSALIEREAPASVLEIGSGAEPTFSPHYVRSRGLTYTINDRSKAELARAGPGYHMLALDVSQAREAELPHQSFDFVFSRMVNEHVANGKGYYRNIYQLLAPGGLTVHCFSTLYAFPFVVNRVLPEAIASRLLDVVGTSVRHQKDKFPARYSWSRGPTRRMIARLRGIGFEVVEYQGFFGHPYYIGGPLKFLRPLEEAKASWLRDHPIPALTSYAVVTLRRPV